MTPEEKTEDMKKRVEEVLAFAKEKGVKISPRLVNNNYSISAIVNFSDEKVDTEETTATEDIDSF